MKKHTMNRAPGSFSSSRTFGRLTPLGWITRHFPLLLLFKLKVMRDIERKEEGYFHILSFFSCGREKKGDKRMGERAVR